MHGTLGAAFVSVARVLQFPHSPRVQQGGGMVEPVGELCKAVSQSECVRWFKTHDH
jgi:hypothetical protein